MKKPTMRTRKRLLLLPVIVIPALFLLFQACKRSDVLSRKSSFNVEDAKEWWYASFRKSPAYIETDKSSVFAAPQNASEKKYPSWKRAVSYKMGNFDVIEAPLVYETKRVLMPGMGDILKTPEGQRIFKSANSRLLLFRKPDGQIDVRISTLVPTREYARKRFYDLSDIHLNDIPKDFEGYQMVRKWNEEQINTYRINKGSRAKQQLKKLGRGNFTLTTDQKLIPKESLKAEMMANRGTVQRSVQSQLSANKEQSVPNTIAGEIEQCDWVWVPRIVEVCIIVQIADEPDEKVCEIYDSDTEGDFEYKCQWVWVPGDDDDPCLLYGINCPPGGGTTDPPDPPDPPAPYDCDCNCEGTEPEMVDANTIFEPRWGQLGTRADIVSEVRFVRQRHPSGYTLEYQFELQTDHFEANRRWTLDTTGDWREVSPQEDAVNRYVYTQDEGWLDMHHVFYAAYLAEKYDNGQDAIALTSMAEWIQWIKDNESAFSYEDKPSNQAGVEFWYQYKDRLENGTMTMDAAVNDYLSSKHALAPSSAPNYDYIPAVLNDKYPQNFSHKGYTGDVLRQKAKEAYCAKTTRQQNNIKDSHQKVPPSAPQKN